MAEHTPGPWTVDEHGVLLAPDGKQIASIFPRDREGNNALIADAPTLKSENIRLKEYAELSANTLAESEADRERLKARVARLETVIQPLIDNSLLAEDALSDVADDDGTILPLRHNLVTAAERARAALQQGEKDE